MTRVSVFGLLVASAAAMALAPVVPASAGSMTRNAARGKATPMVPLFAWTRETCAIYPVQNATIEHQPEHGTASIAKVNIRLPASFGVCAGTNVDMPWVVYQSAGAFSGVDHFTVSWMSHATVLENTSSYQAYDVAVTVKQGMMDRRTPRRGCRLEVFADYFLTASCGKPLPC
ncbi:hypothetical protein ACMDCR_22235 [Labrys okinawensis]|uniref:hypothetical protein n=1 Tax=Labrys okinawensis TaxID=346911 RepID=UPI0039BC2242